MGKIKLSGKRIAVNIIVLVLSVACFAFGGLCVYADAMMSNIHYEKADTQDVQRIVESGSKDFDFGNITSDNLYHDKAVMNIILLSLDNYMQGDSGRTDSMLMISIDTRHEEVKLTSFMRDLYVSIPGYGFDRLNAAYAYGGPSLTIATLEDNFRVDIDRYILIDYKKFVEIIDTVGGVDLEITQEEADVINAESKEDPSLALSAGKVHMTGKQARMYARIRKIDSDFERTNRQRKVVAAVIEKLKGTNLLTLNSYLADILGMITTDMDKDEVLGLVANLMSYLNYDVQSFRLPADGAFYDETVSLYGTPAAVLIPDLKTNSELLAKYVFGEDNVPTLKGTYTLPQYGGVYGGTVYDANANTDDGTGYNNYYDDGGYAVTDDTGYDAGYTDYTDYGTDDTYNVDDGTGYDPDYDDYY